MAESEYVGIPSASLVRPVDNSSPWRLVLGLETVKVFHPAEKPTGTALVEKVNERIRERNLLEGHRPYRSADVKAVGLEILQPIT